MERPLIISVPERPAQPKGPANWGQPMPLVHPSIIELTEEEFVALVLADPYYKRELFNIAGMHGNPARKISVPQKQLNRFKNGAGDIDILVLPDGAPELATCIEVKRFKADVDVHDANLGKPTKLAELMAKGIDQANKKLELGFGQVYLAIFELIDTRKQNGGRLTFDGPNADVRGRINTAISRNVRHPETGIVYQLDSRIGLLECDWVQAIDSPPLGGGGSSGIHLHGNIATPVEPDQKLTEWIRKNFY